MVCWERAERLANCNDTRQTGPVALDLLVLGGTSWLGGAVARLARDVGHRVTCLARGESGSPPTGVAWVRADRTQSQAYDGVVGATWDAVVDLSWQPAHVHAALAALGHRTGHWVYVSSTSVYARDDVPDADESAPVLEPLASSRPADLEVYGPAKVACERACVQALGPDHVLVARAGLIGGFGDRSDRLGYWPARLARAAPGERVLVPPLDAPLQVIDVLDLSGWLLVAAERQLAGSYNAVGDVTTFAALLEAARSAAGTTPDLVEAGHAWLTARGVEPWMGPDSLAVWLPLPECAGLMTRRNDAARAAGLRLRPLSATVHDALRWERESGLDRDRRAGLSSRREAALLEWLGR